MRKHAALLLTMIAVSTLATFSGIAIAERQPISIGSRVELFCDDRLIEKMNDVSLRLHSPVPREVVFRFDAPWENGEGAYATLLQEDDCYRLYYRAGGELTREYTCVAFSRDGISWTRPNLGLFEFEGTRNNNIIWTGKERAYWESHNFSPFKDTNPAAREDQRYKAVTLGRATPPGESDRRKVLMAFVSPDGIRWSRLREEPIITDGSFDSHNAAFWDTAQQQYVCYLRVGREGKRSVARATSKDFIHWSKSEPLDFGEKPIEHFYTNGIEPYFRNPHLYLGFPMRFVPPQDRNTVGLERRQTDGLSDMVFMSSHDGLRWSRYFMEAFVRPGTDPYNWGGAHGNMTPAWHVVQTGETEISIYWLERYGFYTLWVPGSQPGSLVPEQRAKGDGEAIIPQLRRGTLRLDGFASVNAPYKGGEMVTWPLTFEGGRAAINVSTSAIGSVRVEIQDAQGKPIPGFSLSEAEEIWGDEIERVVAWKGGTDVSKLAGKPVRLRFVMRDADLYSIRFRP
ncbi:MAG TPA: hypothetical protein VLM89_12685 [Phycisphaerae bacterium]|nr:hypothetical protein [Phycisphaerae bacterium]